MFFFIKSLNKCTVYLVRPYLKGIKANIELQVQYQRKRKCVK
jgi:hypothetical protein